MVPSQARASPAEIHGARLRRRGVTQVHHPVLPAAERHGQAGGSELEGAAHPSPASRKHPADDVRHRRPERSPKPPLPGSRAGHLDTCRGTRINCRARADPAAPTPAVGARTAIMGEPWADAAWSPDFASQTFGPSAGSLQTVGARGPSTLSTASPASTWRRSRTPRFPVPGFRSSWRYGRRRRFGARSNSLRAGSLAAGVGGSIDAPRHPRAVRCLAASGAEPVGVADQLRSEGGPPLAHFVALFEMGEGRAPHGGRRHLFASRPLSAPRHRPRTIGGQWLDVEHRFGQTALQLRTPLRKHPQSPHLRRTHAAELRLPG